MGDHIISMTFKGAQLVFRENANVLLHAKLVAALVTSGTMAFFENVRDLCELATASFDKLRAWFAYRVVLYRWRLFLWRFIAGALAKARRSCSVGW